MSVGDGLGRVVGEAVAVRTGMLVPVGIGHGVSVGAAVANAEIGVDGMTPVAANMD